MAENVSVARWLERLGLGEYARAFAENRIDAETLRELTADDLKELGVTPLGDRKKLLKAIAELDDGAPSGSRATPSPLTRGLNYQVPPHLAERILGSRAALEGERKQVTVLFADIKGSLELIEGADPEEVGRLFDGVIGSLIDAVHRFEGTVNKVQGDGLMAIFGAPIAHEDHAVRACYAALAMQDAVRTRFSRNERDQAIQIRVGLHAGEVVVRAINTDLSMNYDAVGTTVHLAARMEHYAPPGEIYLTAETLRLVEGFVEVEPQGPMAVKGVAEPVDVFALRGTAARTRWQAALARGLSRFVGRQAALETLTRALDQAAAGQGQLAAIVGEAGVGKSRLVHEFVHSSAARDWQVLAGSSVSYGKATTWLPVIDLLKDYFGIVAGDPPWRLQEKIGARLARLDGSLEAEIPAFVALFDVPVDDSGWQALGAVQQRRRTLNALQALLLRESERRPLLLVFEDLHWIDTETQALLDELVEVLPSHQMMLVVDYRPEYSHSWSSRSYYVQLRLDPLNSTGADDLLRDLLGDAPELGPIKRSLLDLAAGNPLFLEESVRALAESGTLTGEAGAYRLAGELADVNLPATVQAIIAERIDCLAPEDKQLLRSASVIGTNVPLPLLQSITVLSEDQLQRSLSALRAAEFLYQTHLFPNPEYMFKHARTHEVAYRGLLQAQRRVLHARVADAMQRLYPERRTELAEKLAAHLEAGERWEQAAEAYLLAAEKGKRKFTYVAASDYARKAFELAQKVSNSAALRARALTLLGDLASLTGQLDGANEHYERALGLVEEQEEGAVANRIHHRKFARREGVKIAYYDHGSSEEILLFVQPNAYRIAMFQPVVEGLCQEFRIVTFDPLGTGASDPAPDNYSIPERAEDIRAVIETLDCGPVIGIGLSQGGKQLVRLARTYPKLLKRLVALGAPSGPAPGWPEKALRQRQEIISGDFSEFEDFVTDFAYRLYPEPEAVDLAEQYINATLQLPRAVFRGFLAAGYSSPESDVTPLLDEIRTPTLVMHGTADIQVPFADARFLVERLPNAQLYAFEGKGHQPYLTATKEFCDVLRQFARTGTVG